jgi:hypothetical protein
VLTGQQLGNQPHPELKRSGRPPLGIVSAGGAADNTIDDLYALGVDRAWFEKACAEGLPIAEVFDYLTPV